MSLVARCCRVVRVWADLAGLAVVLLVAAGGASIIWSTLRLGISPMPTSPVVRAAALSLLPELREGEVHELGAGFGGVAFALADALPSTSVIAWEASFVPFAVCWLRQRARARRNLSIRRGDLFSADLRRARLVCCYLYPGAMSALAPKLARELPGGAVVLSQTFAVPGWVPETTRRAADLYRTPIYRYVVGRAGSPP